MTRVPTPFLIDPPILSWEERARVSSNPYDLAINLEDTLEVAEFLKTVRFNDLFGAYADPDGSLRYTENRRCWFNFS